MKKAIILLLTIAAGALALPSAALASQYSGEIKIRSIGSDNTDGTLNRFREYSSYPKDGSLSLLKFEFPYFKKAAYLSFKGTDIGEDDVAAKLSASYLDYFSFDMNYNKTPHLIDIRNSYGTERVADSFKLHLLPLGRVSATAMYSVEDKTGKFSTTDLVGQKTKTSGAGVQALVGTVTIAGGISKEDFSENNVAHDTDATMMSANLKPNGKLWASISQDKKTIDPAMSNAASRIDLLNTDTSASYNINDNMTILSTYSDRKRDSYTPGTISFKDKYFTTKLNMRCKLGRAGLTYTTVDRDYAGADITSRNTHKIDLKGSTKVSFFNINAEYEHGYRDISGVTNANPINFNELSGEFAKRDLTVSLLGFKKFNMSLFSKRQTQSFDPFSTYSTHSFDTDTNGLTASYTVTRRIDLTMNYYKMEYRMIGRQNFLTNTGAGTSLLDTTFAINDNTTYFQIGTVHQLTPSLCMYLDISKTSANLSDPQRNNSVKDRTYSISLDKTLTSTYSVNFGFSRNVYGDMLDSTFSPHSTLVNFEVRKKF